MTVEIAAQRFAFVVPVRQSSSQSDKPKSRKSSKRSTLQSAHSINQALLLSSIFQQPALNKLSELRPYEAINPFKQPIKQPVKQSKHSKKRSCVSLPVSPAGTPARRLTVKDVMTLYPAIVYSEETINQPLNQSLNQSIKLSINTHVKPYSLSENNTPKSSPISSFFNQSVNQAPSLASLLAQSWVQSSQQSFSQSINPSIYDDELDHQSFINIADFDVCDEPIKSIAQLTVR